MNLPGRAPAWHYFEVYRRYDLREPQKLVTRYGPVLLARSQVADEILGWRAAERAHGGFITVNVWKYAPDTGWKQGW